MSGTVIIPAADGHENKEFEQRIAQQLALADHRELEEDLERLKRRADALEREIRGQSRILARTKVGRALHVTWSVWSTFFGLVAIAVPIAFGFVYTTSSGQEVILPTDAPQLDVVRLHEGGMLTWKQSIERKEVCPGDAVMTLHPANGESEVISLRRPILNPTIGLHPNVPFNVQLPLSMTDGRWHVVFSFDSRCPLRQRSDTLSEFDIEVVP